MVKPVFSTRNAGESKSFESWPSRRVKTASGYDELKVLRVNVLRRSAHSHRSATHLLPAAVMTSPRLMSSQKIESPSSMSAAMTPTANAATPISAAGPRAASAKSCFDGPTE